MPAARWTSALLGALVTACLFAAPALAETCGNPGYSYAGVVTPNRTAGVRAVITAPVAPQVESGDVSGWIGVGRVGVNGKRGVLRVGLLGETDGTMRLYYEVRRNGNWIRHLGPVVQPGERHFVKVARSHKNAKRWRVLIDGNTVGLGIKLGKGWKWLRAVAAAESWDGGTRSCNQLRYAFGKVKVKGRRGWHRANTRKLIQDPGYKVLKHHKSHFLATNVTPAPAGDARALLRRLGDRRREPVEWQPLGPKRPAQRPVQDRQRPGPPRRVRGEVHGPPWGQVRHDFRRALRGFLHRRGRAPRRRSLVRVVDALPLRLVDADRLVDLHPVALVLPRLAAHLLQHEGRADPGEPEHGLRGQRRRELQARLSDHRCPQARRLERLRRPHRLVGDERVARGLAPDGVQPVREEG